MHQRSSKPQFCLGALEPCIPFATLITKCRRCCLKTPLALKKKGRPSGEVKLRNRAKSILFRHSLSSDGGGGGGEMRALGNEVGKKEAKDN